MNTKVLLLAGGLGTRLRPITNSVPKCLIDIAGRPLLDYWLERFEAAGIREVLINTHHLAEHVRHYIAGVNRSGRFSIREAFEPALLGSAGTVSANRDWVSPGDTCVIVYADNLSNVDLGGLLQYHHGHDAGFTMMLFHTANPKACGIAELDQSGRIIGFVEKPQNPVSNLANGGIYVVNGDAYHEMADLKGFDLGFDVLPAFIGRMYGWVWQGYHRDIGSHEALQLARDEAANAFPADTQVRRSASTGST